MSDKTHCDLCDAVIERTVQHLVLTVGLWEGNEGVDEDDHRDYCPACCAKDSVLQALFDEQLAISGSVAGPRPPAPPRADRDPGTS